MKISAYHKAQGDTVDWWNGLMRYDSVYVARVFDDTYTQWQEPIIQADQIYYGGTGFDLQNKLPDAIERVCPDYSLYPQFSESYGFLTRGCPRNCPFCIVSCKEGRKSVQVANLDDFHRGQKEIKLLDPNLLACRESEKLLQQLIDSKSWVDFTQGLDARLLNGDNIPLLQKVKKKLVHFAWDSDKASDLIVSNLEMFKSITGTPYNKAIVYVLTNYDTDFQFDLYRVNTLRRIGFNPYVMIYDKPSAPRNVRLLQRWVNNRIIWGQCERFEDYDPKVG